MSRTVVGITVDDELYQNLAARRYDIADDWKNVPLETVAIYAESKDLDEYPEIQKECKEIVEQVKTEIRVHYSSKDGRREFKTMKHQEFSGYVQDVQKIQSGMRKEAEKMYETVQKARSKWEQVSRDKSASEASMAAWKAEYLQAEEDYKKSVEALHVDTDKALEKVQEQFQEHLNDFYDPNGSRVDDTVMKLLYADFPFKEGEFDRMISRYTDNPAMLRIFLEYASTHGLESKLMTVLGHHANLCGSKEMAYIRNLMEFVKSSVRDPERMSMYQSRFDMAAENTAIAMRELPVRPM